MIRILLLVLCLLGTGCKKFLGEKPDQKLETLTRISDLQALLNNEQLVSQKNPKAAEVAADDYYLTDAAWNDLSGFDKRMYTWGKQKLFPEGSGNDWSNAYVVVNIANTVLSNLDNIHRHPGDEDEWNDVKGQALFLRGQAFLQIALIWAKPFDEATAVTDPGIPLRLSPDSNIKTTRATMKQTYDQITSDLKMAADLLPAMSKHILRPSKCGAYALLARTYLSMRKYTDMGAYADLSLKIKSSLKDFNTLQDGPAGSWSFAPRSSNEEEVIFESGMMNAPALNVMTARIDSNLYASFAENDLRKKYFFRSNGGNSYGFKGNYTGTWVLFSGLATDEVYLMRAEYYARAGNVTASMADLNRLLEKRFMTNTFVPLTANTAKDALMLILLERRKELIMRGLRWMDIKRLNKEHVNIILRRTIQGETFVLPPNDPRYAMPIPEDVIRITGITQNPV